MSLMTPKDQKIYVVHYEVRGRFFAQAALKTEKVLKEVLLKQRIHDRTEIKNTELNYLSMKYTFEKIANV